MSIFLSYLFRLSQFYTVFSFTFINFSSTSPIFFPLFVLSTPSLTLPASPHYHSFRCCGHSACCSSLDPFINFPFFPVSSYCPVLIFLLLSFQILLAHPLRSPSPHFSISKRISPLHLHFLLPTSYSLPILLSSS